MNDQILPALGFTPCELLWGQCEKTGEKLTVEKETETTEHDTTHHLIFTELLRSQGYTDALVEATRRKACFDDQVHPVEFNAGDLVQVYNSKLDVTYKTKAKLLPHWSPPQIIADRLLNSYMLRRLDGTELRGMTHARCLCQYIPRRNGPVNHMRLMDTPTSEMLQWDEDEDEDEAAMGIQSLFENPDATRTYIT